MIRSVELDDWNLPAKQAVVAQLVEHVLGKDEVTGPIPVNGSVGNGWGSG